MKRILVTAGTADGQRGVWASKLALFLAERGHEVTLLVPPASEGPEPSARLTLSRHSGAEDYAAKCLELAPKLDAAVLAAAVKGPPVVERMKAVNPGLTLIGCALTTGATPEDTVKAGQETMARAHCTAVIANDLQSRRQKMLLSPDGHRVDYQADATPPAKGFTELSAELEALIRDEHYRTENYPREVHTLQGAVHDFDELVRLYRKRFVSRAADSDRVFGAIAVRIDEGSVLMSPRDPRAMLSAKDAVVVSRIDPLKHLVFTVNGAKAALNAPLLWRVLWKTGARAVLHLHEQHAGWPTLPYAPPGTVRDSDRELRSARFNLEGHGFVAALPERLDELTL